MEEYIREDENGNLTLNLSKYISENGGLENASKTLNSISPKLLMKLEKKNLHKHLNAF